LSCGKCEEICSQGVILPVRLEENIETTGSPKLSFAENYCNLCMECTKICPTGALQRIRQAEALIGIAKVISDRCSAWTGGNCNFCVTRCPFRAIRTDGSGRPYVVAELCTGCGICEQACRLTAGKGFTKGIVVFPIG
jgi:ferredoxin